MSCFEIVRVKIKYLVSVSNTIKVIGLIKNGKNDTVPCEQTLFIVFFCRKHSVLNEDEPGFERYLTTR